MKGVLNIHEGVTIARPNGPLPGNVKTLAVSSSGYPCIMCYDENESLGRIVIDTGYTKLYKEFYRVTAGTGIYF